jgi:hypothetical protein
VLVIRPGWAEPDHPEPDHPEPGHPAPGHPAPGHAEWVWGGDPAERTRGGERAEPDDPGGARSGRPAEPALGESPAAGLPAGESGESRAGGSPVGGSRAGGSGAGGSGAGGWPWSGRGSGAGERAWPWSDDPPLLTKEAADRLNPWGDDQPSATPTRRACLVVPRRSGAGAC